MHDATKVRNKKILCSSVIIPQRCRNCRSFKLNGKISFLKICRYHVIFEEKNYSYTNIVCEHYIYSIVKNKLCKIYRNKEINVFLLKNKHSVTFKIFAITKRNGTQNQLCGKIKVQCLWRRCWSSCFV